MKKNISINISGIIFYIEEDGYDKLKEYLDSINSYFSRFDESNEIVTDIESRIAEIFLSKLKDGKQVVTLEDVDSLIATMGSIRDFKAVQEPEEEKQQEEPHEEYSGTTTAGTKKLFRDNKRKVIGGVAAGLGNYFSLDPLWFRLIFLLLFISFFFEFGISLIVPLIYIVMWVVIPGSDELEEGKKYRKMYRNPDDKVLGGVSSGIASYFGVDVVVVRLIFVILIFAAFSGPIIYVLLWIIIPEAKSITEKMEMQGEPVTLSNIEENIKKSLNVKEGEENVLVKILLFPFRLLSLIISWLGKALSPLLKFLVEAVRIVAGIFIVIAGVSLMFALLVVLGAGIGLLSGNYLVNIDFLPLELIQNSLPVAPFVALIIVGFIPALFIALLGVMIISKTNLIKPGLGWSLFAIWIIASLSLAISIPQTLADFKMEANVKQEETYDIAGTAVLTMTDTYPDMEYDDVELRIRAHDDSTFLLEKDIESRGSSIENARENAEMLIYEINVQDSVMKFPYTPTFSQNAVFRGQNLELILYVPYERPFILEPKLANILRNTLSIYGYRARDMRDNTWKFTREDGLICVTCEQPSKDRDNFAVVDQDVTDFTYLDVGNTFILNIRQGGNYQVEINDENALERDLVMEKNGETLKIRYRENDNFFDANRNKIKINITMPELNGLYLQGASQTFIQEFNLDDLRINLSGSAYAEARITADNLDLELTGASRLVLNGAAKNMSAELNGIANLEAFEMVVEEANIEATAAANANLYVTELLEADASGGTTIKYKGNPKVNKEASVASSIRRVE